MCNENGSLIVTNCSFTGNVAAGFDGSVGVGGGMYIGGADLRVTNCTFSGNIAGDARSNGNGGGMYNYYCSSLIVTNCTFTGNVAVKEEFGYGGGGGGMCNYFCGSPTVTNCTFSGNSSSYGGGMYNHRCDSLMLTKSILWGNTADYGNEVYSYNLYYNSISVVSYCDIKGCWDPNDSGALADWDLDLGIDGGGNIDADPYFADTDNNDYHLKSEAGRWDPCSETWVTDTVTSPCIDAGNPGSLLANEPMTLDVDPLNRWGENLRINMGAYGGTAKASMPPYDWALLADLTNDGIVNLADFANQAVDWQQTEIAQPGDLNRSGTVDLNDALLMATDWLKRTSWY